MSMPVRTRTETSVAVSLASLEKIEHERIEQEERERARQREEQAREERTAEIIRRRTEEAAQAHCELRTAPAAPGRTRPRERVSRRASVRRPRSR